jgi:hypothetical protein
MIGAERCHQIQVPCAAHASHFGAERFGNLYCVGSNATGSAVDQDLLSGLKPSVVAHSL